MATIDRAKVCTECLSEPKRVRRGKKFPLCEECRAIITKKKWKVRSLKRILIEGRTVQFYDTGWRVGYLIKLRETRADVQPVGAVGRIPEVIGVNIEDLKKEAGASKLWETVEDFYKANTRKKPVVLVADPQSAVLDTEISRFFRQRDGKPEPIVRPVAPQPVEQKPVHEASVMPEPKQKKARGEKILIGALFGTWKVDSDTGHGRFACTCTSCGKKKTIFSRCLRDSSAPCEHK